MIRQLNFQLVLKRFLLIFLPLLALVSTIVALFYYIEAKNAKAERRIFETNELNYVNLQLKTIINDFNMIKSDLMVLIGHHEMYKMLETGEVHHTQALAKEFLLFCDAKGIYDQLRLLDEKGMEILRINYNNGKPYIVPKDQLQNKGKRYYFEDTFSLNEKNVFVSPFDLNIEGGEIEQPPKPMIRFCTPVFDSKGRKRAIVVLNYLGENLINELKTASASAPGHVMLVNSAGYWLLGIKPEDEWAFMYEDRKVLTLCNTYPNAWQRISLNESGHFYNTEGLFTFETVSPLFQGWKSSSGSGKAFERSDKDLKANEYTWKIISHVTPGILSARLGNYTVILLSIYGVVITLIGCGSWIVANSGVRRKIAERMLRESEKLLNEAQHIAKTGSWEYNLENNQINCSYEQYRIFGYEPDEIDLTFDNILKTIHPDDRKAFLENYRRCIKVDSTYSNEYRIIKPDGSERAVYSKAKLIRDRSGKLTKMLGTIQDITEHKKMEEALLQSEKLKSIGTVTTGIAHEFNNILAIISGNIQLVEDSYKDHAELTDALCTIQKAVDDGAEISSKMLKFTKVINDDKKVKPFDIRDIIRQSIDFTMPRWKNMAQANGINYHFDKEDMKTVTPVLCNPTELREVFINIINNALEAMPDGGTITVATRCILSEVSGVESKKENVSELLTPNAKPKGDFVEITFTDTGKGMTKDVIKNVFDPFFTTRRPEGTGLGLSISYGIITRHGGKIDVESKLGKGTTFTLRLPTTIKTVSQKEAPLLEQKIKIKELCILVVDDEEAICNILIKFLSKDNHKVKAVDNGAEAIRLAKKENFDLVLCDIAMPEVSGYDVIQALNILERRPKIGIITGWGEKLRPLKGDNMKVDFILRKPFISAELTRHINDALEV
ncbi:MAG: PAS domain-containing protein [Candidatus Scalindua sp.]|nr:PAS domain-containing protein [Candidatus Scalindua sp.]